MTEDNQDMVDAVNTAEQYTHDYPPKTLFVLAGNYQQAVNWSASNGISPRNMVYLGGDAGDTAYRTMGRRGGTFVRVGTWDDRPYREILEILAILKVRDFTEREV